MLVRQKVRKKIRKDSKMASFWLNKPVNTSSKVEIILSRDKLLQQVSNEIDNAKLKLEIEIVDLTDNTTRIEVLSFINENYDYPNDEFKLEYSLSLFNYFLQSDCIPIVFYSKKLHKMVGFILGIKKQMIIENKSFPSIEVNFLCILNQLRDLHLSSYMINVLTKKAVENDTTIAIYTVGKEIKVPAFCRKQYFHLPINYSVLKETGMIDPKLQEKTIEIDHCISYYNCNDETITEEFVEGIQNKVEEFSKINYVLYDEKSRYQVREWFTNPVFHVFDCNNNFYCFYRLDTKHKESGKLLKNGYLYVYTSFGKELRESIKKIRSYCKEHDIFDMITVVDPFGFSVQEYTKLGFLKGTGCLNYYYYNLRVPKMAPSECGFVTI